ncbi:zinc metalloprotease HtpX [candidate division TA06 bacterium]|nr:zinc metalloprotease HtpX [candidate division TA06 bacterium]
MNTFKTFGLMFFLTLLLVWAGGAFGGRVGAIFALVIAGAMNFFAYWFSDKVILKIYRGKEVSETEEPELVGAVRELSQRVHLPMPKVYILPMETPNAFATGRDPQHAAIAASQGILKLLDRDELMGVLGHELAHIRNRDILISTIVATLAGALMLISRIAGWSAMFGGFGGRGRRGGGNIIVLLLLIIVVPIAAILIQMAISRSREYAADAGGSMISGRPLGLAGALEKLEKGVARRPLNASPATAHLFIVNPLRGGRMVGLFTTHPPTKERVARLQKIAREMGQ